MVLELEKLQAGICLEQRVHVIAPCIKHSAHVPRASVTDRDLMTEEGSG